MGLSKSLLWKHEEAIKDFDKAINLDPEDFDCFYERGHSKYCLNQYEEGIKDFNKAIDSNPEESCCPDQL